MVCRGGAAMTQRGGGLKQTDYVYISYGERWGAVGRSVVDQGGQVVTREWVGVVEVQRRM